MSNSDFKKMTIKKEEILDIKVAEIYDRILKKEKSRNEEKEMIKLNSDLNKKKSNNNNNFNKDEKDDIDDNKKSFSDASYSDNYSMDDLGRRISNHILYF